MRLRSGNGDHRRGLRCLPTQQVVLLEFATEGVMMLYALIAALVVVAAAALLGLFGYRAKWYDPRDGF